jgi:hypothetical protein
MGWLGSLSSLLEVSVCVLSISGLRLGVCTELTKAYTPLGTPA